MQYSEPAALEIIQQFNLAPNTLRVWKTRNSIPDRYFSGAYDKPEPKTEMDTSKLIKFLSLPFVKKSCFDKYIGYVGSTCQFCECEINITQSQFEAIQREIDVFLSLWRQTIETTSQKLLRALLAKEMLKPFVLFKNDLSKAEIKNIIDRLNSTKEPDNLQVVFARLKKEYKPFL